MKMFSGMYSVAWDKSIPENLVECKPHSLRFAETNMAFATSYRYKAPSG